MLSAFEVKDTRLALLVKDKFMSVIAKSMHGSPASAKTGPTSSPIQRGKIPLLSLVQIGRQPLIVVSLYACQQKCQIDTMV
jgi:hypothetical protein